MARCAMDPTSAAPDYRTIGHEAHEDHVSHEGHEGHEGKDTRSLRDTTALKSFLAKTAARLWLRLCRAVIFGLFVADTSWSSWRPLRACGTSSGMAIIECVPNVSEGRRADVVETLVSAIRSVPGVRVLDSSSDPSHNRSVLTLAGEAGPLQAAILALFEKALAVIDLRTHTGEHPRLGAVDVVPFVPIEGVTMAECATLAREIGRAVAR